MIRSTALLQYLKSQHTLVKNLVQFRCNSVLFPISGLRCTLGTRSCARPARRLYDAWRIDASPCGWRRTRREFQKDFSRVLTVLTLRFCRGSCCVQDMLWPHFPQFDWLLSVCKSRCPTDHPTRQTQMSKWAAEVQCHVHCCPVGKEFSGQECSEIVSACDFPTFGFAILCFTWTKGWYSPKFP